MYYSTAKTKTSDLKKGMIVQFYGVLFIITKDAQNFGQETEPLTKEVKNDEWDVWGAAAKYIKGTGADKDGLLRNYDWFQSNTAYQSARNLVVGELKDDGTLFLNAEWDCIKATIRNGLY